MLCTISITDSLSGKVTGILVESFANFDVLAALEAVQKDATKSLLKVFLQTSNDLEENVSLRGSSLASGLFKIEVVIQDLVDRLGSWQGDELLVLGDILPIIDENRLDVVWYWKVD